mgnify:CR=1 FL=1
MLYTEEDVFSYVEQEDVKFIRLAFCDVSGKQKNISIMPQELKRAFSQGISFDASAVSGFGGVEESDLFLFPIPSTLTDLPWRPSRGKVVRMLCQIRYPDGAPFPMDCRALLARAIQDARQAGLSVQIGAEFEFYLFKTDADGNPTTQPFDHAGYMDVAPEDKGENVRREICLTLEHMGIAPESSHHEEGPGQNEIDFRYSDAMTAADNALLFTSVVKAVAVSNGLYADFSPKPIADQAGNGLHINISVRQDQGEHVSQYFMTGILEHIREMTAFLNPCDASYRRLGERKAPRYVTWSPGNRSQLIRIPAAQGEYKRMELRSPDPMVNPHLAYALVIYAGLDGVKRKLLPPEPLNVNLYTADHSVTAGLETLPGSLKEARDIAMESPFIQSVLPEGFWK